ncbi:MAG: hypothetical protein ABI835_17020 [Chloroflexota bacterium]
MPDNTLVVVALVGLAVVCLGLLLVAFIMLLRFAGSRPLSLLSMLLGSREDDRESGRVTTAPRPNLREIAQSNDFDAALAKHVVQDEIEPQIARQPFSTPLPPVQSQAANPAADSMFDEIPQLGSRRTDRRANVRRDDDDDLIGDMLD